MSAGNILRAKSRQLPTTVLKRVSRELFHDCPRLTHQRLLHLDQPVQVSEPNHHLHHCPVKTKPNQVMFNNMDTNNVVTNTDDEEVTIPPAYYSIGKIITMLNTMTDDTTFSISTKASSYGCIWIPSPYSIHFTMLRTSEKSSVWKGERSFYSLRSMVRM